MVEPSVDAPLVTRKFVQAKAVPLKTNNEITRLRMIDFIFLFILHFIKKPGTCKEIKCILPVFEVFPTSLISL